MHAADETAVWTSPIQVLDDGDPATAVNLNSGAQGAIQRTDYLKAKTDQLRYQLIAVGAVGSSAINVNFSGLSSTALTNALMQGGALSAMRALDIIEYWYEPLIVTVADAANTATLTIWVAENGGIASAVKSWTFPANSRTLVSLQGIYVQGDAGSTTINIEATSGGIVTNNVAGITTSGFESLGGFTILRSIV